MPWAREAPASGRCAGQRGFEDGLVDDIMLAMAELGYDQAVRNEVPAISCSLNGDIIRV